MNSVFSGLLTWGAGLKKKPSGSPGLVGFCSCRQAMVRGKRNVPAACWEGGDQINNGTKFRQFWGYDPIRFYLIWLIAQRRRIGFLARILVHYCCSLGVWSSTKRREKDYYCHQYRRNQVSKSQGIIKAYSQQFKIMEKVLISRR